jgi:hypothetical protein
MAEICHYGERIHPSRVRFTLIYAMIDFRATF